MENLEEILQALDEFQKMRPSEIPRELEDYLCWVAKTGDPVYQWSLIKTLFREKLIRVMTDFYESCPRLDLTRPSPNVEQFNYDTMKSNLLERLESFANAPFTVQRICELLTAPRKEYNRVDKFMRAIEKNILVVSTREPGPIARRSENGDGMVNGSMEAEAAVAQSPQDVEMEYWEKDCPSTVTISVHSVENENQTMHTVVSSGAQQKAEQPSDRSEVTVSNFISSNAEFTNVANLAPDNQIQDSTVISSPQNIPSIPPESTSIVGDVPDAIMNEDTSSQPGLDLENEECEVTESSKKLQTTFQAKDFTLADSKSSKLYLDNEKINEKAQVGTTEENMSEEVSDSAKIEDEAIETNLDAKPDVERRESVSPIVENLLKVDHSKSEDKIVLENISENIAEKNSKDTLILGNVHLANSSCINDPEPLNVAPVQPYEMEKAALPSEECQSTVILPADDMVSRISNDNEEMIASASSDTCINVIQSNEKIENTMLNVKDPKSSIEESVSDCTNAEECSNDANLECTNVTIVETTDDKTRGASSLVPEPIPIVEEPKDAEPLDVNLEKATTSVEILEESESCASNEKCQLIVDDKPASVEKQDLVGLQGKQGDISIKVIDNESLITENVFQNSEYGSVELMDVDGEESLSVYPRDEQTEQEPMELTDS